MLQSINEIKRQRIGALWEVELVEFKECLGVNRLEVEVFIGHVEAAECVCDYVVFALGVDELWAVLFKDEAPAHDSFRVERFEREVLVVSEDLDPLA